MGIQDSIKGAVDKAKEALGALTADDKLDLDGKAQAAFTSARSKLDEVVGQLDEQKDDLTVKASSTFDEIKGKLDDALQSVRGEDAIDTDGQAESLIDEAKAHVDEAAAAAGDEASSEKSDPTTSGEATNAI